MKNRLLIAFGTLLLVGAGAWVLFGPQRPDSDGPPHALRDERPRAVLSRPTSREAARALHRMLEGSIPLDYPFARLEKLAGQLDDAELQALLDEVGLLYSDNDRPRVGIQGWIRSALYAEWGRRDPEALRGMADRIETLAREALARNEDQTLTMERIRPLLSQWYSLEIDQACFALFRGRFERQPLTASSVAGLLEEFAQLETAVPGSSWRQHSTRLLFAEFARLDPEGAWAALPAEPAPTGNIVFTHANHPRHFALEGLFRGTQDPVALEALVQRWEPVWTSEATRLARQAHENHGRSGLSFHMPAPPELGVRLEATMALARHDLEWAETWVGETSDPEREDFLSMGEWASRNPRQALSLLGNPDHPNHFAHHHSIAKALVRANPARAHEVIQALPDAASRESVLFESITLGRSPSWNDHYPVPGEPSVVPDLRQRHDALQTAVATAGLDEAATSRLNEILRKSFESVLEP